MDRVGRTAAFGLFVCLAVAAGCGTPRPATVDMPPPEPVVTETDVQPDVGLAVDDEGDLERTPVEQVIGWLFQ